MMGKKPTTPLEQPSVLRKMITSTKIMETGESRTAENEDLEKQLQGGDSRASLLGYFSDIFRNMLRARPGNRRCAGGCTWPLC